MRGDHSGIRLPVSNRKHLLTEPLRARLPGWSSRLPPFVDGSMTVEAALVLPLFIFFMAQLLYVFEMIRLQSRLLQALHETGTEMSRVAFYSEYALNDLSDLLGIESDSSESTASGLEELLNEETGLVKSGISLLLSATYVQNSVEEYLGTDWLNASCLEGGAEALSYLQSEIMEEDDIIDLVADYRVSPFLSIFGLDSFSMQTRYYGHAWTGYEVGSISSEEDSDEETVYITATGTVYHRSRSCTYLQPSTRAVSASEIDSLRNSSGARYYACEVCDPVKSGTLIVTTDGNRYHSSTTCSALKRTIYEVPLSQVEDSMSSCSKCGGSS